MTRIEIMGLPLDNVTMLSAVESLTLSLCSKGASRQVAFLNADCVNLAAGSPEYRETLSQADWVFGDGAGVKLAAWASGCRLQDNVNGTDLYPVLMDVMSLAGRSLYLLGAKPGVAQRMAENARKRWPGLRIAGVRDGYFDERQEEEVVAEIRRAQPDLLLVALGAPRQDNWIRENLPRLGVRVAMGVGGLFDFYSGRLPRAPGWIRSLHMEWAYRLYQEPRRLWRRYLVGNAVFLFRLFLSQMIQAAPDLEGAR